MPRSHGPLKLRCVIGLLSTLFLMLACGGDAGDPPTSVVSGPRATPSISPLTRTLADGSATPTSESRDWSPDPGLDLLEPASGVYFGVNLDWDNDSAAAFNERIGMDAAAFVQFAPFPFDDRWEEHLNLFVAQVAQAQGIAVLTLEPTIPLEAITSEQAEDLARFLRVWNDQGVGVMLRFAHEMNGSWYAWGQQPQAYIAAFRLIADAVHTTAPGTAMLWAPNYGAGYPFVGGAFGASTDAPDFALLDTDGNGTLDEQDDPYAPYYPGDDAVDWVGLSLYHWGHAYPWGENEIPEAGKFVAQLSGTYNGANGDETATPDFHAVYAEQHNKPLAIVETAALFNTTDATADELALKRAWWQQVFSPEVFDRFPRLRMINWFEWNKPESEIGGSRIDWTVTQDPSILAAFVEDLPRDHLRFAPAPD